MKFLICVPSGDEVAAGFAQSLACLSKPDDTAVSFVCGSLIYDARNKLAKQAIQINTDYILWLDSDMIFPNDTLIRLLNLMEERDASIVSGLYFRRAKPYTPVAFKKIEIEPESSWEGFDDYPDDPFEAAAAGFGCVLMKAQVLYDVAGKFGTWFNPLKGFGEDISFFWRASECGHKVLIDPRIKLGHVGKTIISEEFFRAVKKEKKDESKN